MNMENDKNKDVEDILQKHQLKKVPPHILSGFTEGVVERIQKKPAGKWAAPSFRLTLRAIGPIAVCALLAIAVLLPKKSELFPQPAAAVARAELPVDQSLALLEAVEGPEAFVTNGVFEAAEAIQIVQATEEDVAALEDELQLLEELEAEDALVEGLAEEEISG